MDTSLLQEYNVDKNTFRFEKSWTGQALRSNTIYINHKGFSLIGENWGIDGITLENIYLFDNNADVIIGNNTTIFSGTKILRQSEIGANCILHNNVVVGSDGFGFSPTAKGSYEKVPQTGSVLIEDDVEIGANTTIDRATLGQTIIRKGVKLDNLIQIAHNVEIGPHTVIAAQSGVAGSTKVGSDCVIGGQAGIAGHLKIGDRGQIKAKTGVLRNLKDDEKVMGFPALDYRSYNKSYVHFKNLPKHIETLDKLQKDQS